MKKSAAAAVKPESKLNASQKLEALETKITDLESKLDRAIQLLLERVNSLADTDVALAKRINAIVKAGDEGGVTTDSVKTAVVNQAATELKARVQMLIDNGLLTLDNESPITSESFVVGRELSSEGEEINPRIQFAVKSLQQEVQDSLIGKKAGESISDEKSQTSMEITEVYTINQPQVEASEEQEAEAAQDASEESVG
jgi:hypothetical protein